MIHLELYKDNLIRVNTRDIGFLYEVKAFFTEQVEDITSCRFINQVNGMVLYLFSTPITEHFRLVCCLNSSSSIKPRLISWN